MEQHHPEPVVGHIKESREKMEERLNVNGFSYPHKHICLHCKGKAKER